MSVDERAGETELRPARPLGIVIGARQPREGYIQNYGTGKNGGTSICRGAGIGEKERFLASLGMTATTELSEI
jgi:hypothetical protein